MKRLTDNFEENTQSPDLTHSSMPRKRRTESPWFWLQLLGGSLVFHGALLAIALPITTRLSASQSDPTPVEFVELSESSLPTVNPPSTESTASIMSSPAPAVLPSSASNETIPPNDISFAPELTPAIPRSPIPSPESLLPESSPEPSPEISPSPAIQTEAPFETAAVPPQPDSLPLPVLPSASPIQPSPEPSVTQRTSEAAPEASVPQLPSPEPSTPEVPSDRSSDRPQPVFPPTATTAALPTAPDLPVPQPETLPSDPGLQTTAIDIPVPDVSEAIAAVPSTVDSNDLNSANSEAAPVRVTLNLSSSSRIDPGGDTAVETLEVASPLSNSTTFLPDPSTSTCQVTPNVLNWIGTPIALKITTDNQQGKPLDVSVYQSSGSPDYDQLAACLVKQWNFEPATALNAGETQRQAIASDELLITITIDRS